MSGSGSGMENGCGERKREREGVWEAARTERGEA